jgi:hypothetical protein
MLQLELYSDRVEETAKLFIDVFGLSIINEHDGWRHLHHTDNYDIMLFDPRKVSNAVDHWPSVQMGSAGSGIEIVICTTNIEEKRQTVIKFGYVCSELRSTPWGSIEFTFHLKEGYLLRIKQPVNK